jgi:hypothetical protein
MDAICFCFIFFRIVPNFPPFCHWCSNACSLLGLPGCVHWHTPVAWRFLGGHHVSIRTHTLPSSKYAIIRSHLTLRSTLIHLYCPHCSLQSRYLIAFFLWVRFLLPLCSYFIIGTASTWVLCMAFPSFGSRLFDTFQVCIIRHRPRIASTYNTPGNGLLRTMDRGLIVMGLALDWLIMNCTEMCVVRLVDRAMIV